jgi:8-oxo-dGTP diphosphatase
VYAGMLLHEVALIEEKNKLFWLDLNEDFFDFRRFAGEGNIGHMVEILKQSGLVQ